MRVGSEYVNSLRDARHVYLDGDLVRDVTSHPAFAGPVRAIAHTYDQLRAADHSAGLTFADPGSGERFSTAWLLPHSEEDLAARRRAHVHWAEGSYGLMGRAPDHVAAMLVGFAGNYQFFDRGEKQLGGNVRRFYDKAKREDLYLAYGIVPPQIDRSQSAAGQPEPFMFPGAVAEKDGGIVVRGAQMLGTSAVIADWILITYIVPLQAADKDYAISVVIPMDAPGLKLYPRRPYATIATSNYDYPLSSRYDETDSLVVMDDVFVPWEHVFIYKDVALCNAQFAETGAHLLGNYQALVRFVVKLQFMSGLAQKLTDVNGSIGQAHTQSMLGGEIAAFVSAMDALADSAQTRPRVCGELMVPNAQFVYSGMSLQRRWIVELSRQMRELAGGAFISVPSSERSFAGVDTQADARRYYQSAGTPAQERVKFLKLMWDMVGTEFAGRQLQYEMFYSAHQNVIDGRVYRNFDWSWGRRLVDECLAEYSMSEELR